VIASRIRVIEEKSKSPSKSPTARSSPAPEVEKVVKVEKVTFMEGDAIEGDWKGKGSWCPGVISADREDGTYNIEYDDGDKEFKVPITRIRVPEKSGKSDDTRHTESSPTKASAAITAKADTVVRAVTKGKAEVEEEIEVKKPVVKVPEKVKIPDKSPVKEPEPVKKQPTPVKAEEKVIPSASAAGAKATPVPIKVAETKKIEIKQTPASIAAPVKAKEQNGRESKDAGRESIVSDIADFLQETGGLIASNAKRSAEAAYSKDITSVSHLQRMLKVVNFSLESIFLSKSQADRILGTIKGSPVKPTPAAAPATAPSRPLVAPNGRK
jgi:hypothetical protein